VTLRRMSPDMAHRGILRCRTTPAPAGAKRTLSSNHAAESLRVHGLALLWQNVSSAVLYRIPESIFQ